MTKAQRTIIISMWAVTALAAVGLGGLIWMMRSNQAATMGTPQILPLDTSVTAGTENSRLPALFDSPEFSLTDENGKTFSSDQLRGKIWVADFIFTNCDSLCPMMTAHLAEFQKLTRGSDVQMVSFTVDPDRDNPAALKKYGQNALADESRWHFLTGTRAQTWDISKAMKLAVGPDRGDQVMHSSHFLLVDGAGHVRGIYDSNEAGFLSKLVDDANWLARPPRN
jgi:protein SCO1